MKSGVLLTGGKKTVGFHIGFKRKNITRARFVRLGRGLGAVTLTHLRPNSERGFLVARSVCRLKVAPFELCFDAMLAHASQREAPLARAGLPRFHGGTR